MAPASSSSTTRWRRRPGRDRRPLGRRARSAAPRRRRPRADDGRAARRPRRALRSRARRVRRPRREPVRQPGAVLGRRATSIRTRATSTRDAERAEAPRASTCCSHRPPRRCTRPGFATWVDPEGAAEGLESEHRPGHFRGVATVCLKLFNIVRPQIAWFGRKDAQQVAVVKQLVRDLNVSVEIRVVDTVRDADGLALSSRNARLSPPSARSALAIPRALATARRRRRRAPCSRRPASSPTTSPSPTSTAPPSRSPRASARRA